jgi:GMP synthase-like glutamine amidotransferase
MKRDIAILLTNTDRSEFAARHPNDGEKVASFMRAIRPEWNYRVWRAIDGEVPAHLDGLAGIVITGSPASVNDTHPWVASCVDVVVAAHQKRLPIVGLCFGHQLIAKALGGEVKRAAAWGLGRGHIEVQTRQPWMTPASDRLRLFAVHQDQVTTLPPQATLLGGSAFCPNGLYCVEDHILAVQYHPELSLGFMRELLEHIGPALPPALVRQALIDIEEPVDANVFFQWVVAMIEQASTQPSSSSTSYYDHLAPD